MENVIKFATVKSAYPSGYLTSGENILNPTGEGRHYLNSLGSLFLRLAVRAKLWFLRSLVQVTGVLDESKPRGRLVFFMGSFSFVFLCLKC